MNKKNGAIEIVPSTPSTGNASFSGSAASCGVRGFVNSVHGGLSQNCKSCHGGGGPGPSNFAASDPLAAYASARSRANFGNASASLLVTKSSQTNHGGGCSACGAAWGSALAGMIDAWAKAENNDPAICAALPSIEIGTGGSGSGPFDDGIYNPGVPGSIEVIPEGLSEYSKVGGVQELVLQNCRTCHVPGGRGAVAQFSVSDAVESYKAAKPRADFVNLNNSKLINRISDAGHGDGGCTVCGNNTYISAMTDRIDRWADAEITGIQAQKITISSQKITLGTAPGSVVNLSWDLGQTNSLMNGARFLISVEQSSLSASNYRFFNPRIITGNRIIHVQNVYFVVNNTLNPLLSMYSRIDQKVPTGVNLGQVLSTKSELVTIVSRTNDEIGFSFSILRAE